MIIYYKKLDMNNRFGGRYLEFLLSVSLDNIHNRAFLFKEPENMMVAVRISLLDVAES